MAKGFKTFLDDCEIIGKTGLGSQASETIFYNGKTFKSCCINTDVCSLP